MEKFSTLAQTLFLLITFISITSGVSINFRNQTKNNFVNQFDRLNNQEIKTVVITTTSTPATASSGPVTNSSSTLCNIKVFKKLRLSWLDAYRVCKNIGNGTELVSIKSEADFQVLTAQIKDARSPVSVVYWTSGTDILDEGIFVWMSDGSEINAIDEEETNVSSTRQSRWATGQPDNLWETEHCVALRRTITDSEYKLTDENCLMSGAFICAQRCFN